MAGRRTVEKTEAPPAASWHLATNDEEAALSELEWTLLRWHESYERFTREALNTVGNTALTAQETMLLHIIRMHDRPKTTSMIANLLNRTDIQNLQYSTRKLVSLKLVGKVKSGRAKSAALTATPLGRRLCDDLAEFRRATLLETLRSLEGLAGRLGSVTKTASMLTAMYDEAEREAVRPPGAASKPIDR